MNPLHASSSYPSPGRASGAPSPPAQPARANGPPSSSPPAFCTLQVTIDPRFQVAPPVRSRRCRPAGSPAGSLAPACPLLPGVIVLLLLLLLLMLMSLHACAGARAIAAAGGGRPRCGRARRCSAAAAPRRPTSTRQHAGPGSKPGAQAGAGAGSQQQQRQPRKRRRRHQRSGSSGRRRHAGMPPATWHAPAPSAIVLLSCCLPSSTANVCLPSPHFSLPPLLPACLPLLPAAARGPLQHPAGPLHGHGVHPGGGGHGPCHRGARQCGRRRQDRWVDAGVEWRGGWVGGFRA